MCQKNYQYFVFLPLKNNSNFREAENVRKFDGLVWFMVLNATFNNISVISYENFNMIMKYDTSCIYFILIIFPTKL